MSIVTRDWFRGGQSKDTLDVFTERFSSARDYHQSSQPNLSMGNPYDERASLSRAKSSKEIYAQELKEQMREQMARKQSRDEQLKRQEQQLLQQNMDNYPFGRTGIREYNVRRKPLSSQQEEARSGSGQYIAPYPANNYHNNFERQKNDFAHAFQNSAGPGGPGYGRKPPLPIENGNGYFADKNAKETVDRREQIKEQWLKELNEQRAQQAKMKEEERRKQKEEELMFEEKNKEQMRELTRDILSDVQTNPAPRKDDKTYAEGFTQRGQHRGYENDSRNDGFSTKEYYSPEDVNEYVYEKIENQKRQDSANNNRGRPILAEKSYQVEEEGYNAMFNNRVETLKQEIEAGRKLFAQQIRDASAKMGIDPHRVVLDRREEGGNQEFREPKYKGNYNHPNQAGPEHIQFYDGRTGALAERTLNLEEMRNNVNSKFVMDSKEYLQALASSTVGQTNENAAATTNANRENNQAPVNYKGTFDSDDKGMQTTDLELLVGREISKYTTLLNENHYNPAMYPFMGRMDEDDFKKLQSARQEQVEKQEKMRREKETKELAEPSKYFEKIDEMLKEFRREFK